MCLSSSWQQKAKSFFPLDIFSKLAEETFHSIERLILYGMGEPLMHPSFIEMLEIAKENLSTNASLFFLTNGSLLSPKTTDQILENQLANEITFSCETLIPEEKLVIGHSHDEKTVQSNLKYLLNQMKNARILLCK